MRRSLAAIKGARKLRRFPLHTTLIVLGLIWAIPLAGLLLNSFRPPGKVQNQGWWTSISEPGQFTLSNYQTVLSRNGLFLSVFNSFAVVVPATLITIAVGAAGAYALSAMKFKLGNATLLTMILLLVVPIQITLVPLLKVLGALGLTGSFAGLWLVHVGYGAPFAVYLLHSFFSTLPKELFEAAEIDGASRSQVFFRIVLPVSRPALAALAIFDFVFTWNDLLAALIFLGGFRDVAPVTVTVSQLVSSRGNGQEILNAAAVLSVIVPMAVFIAMQRHFVRGLLAGTAKG